MDDKEKNNLASELLKLLYEESPAADIPAKMQTVREINTLVEKDYVAETEFVARRRDMTEISDFFCRDSRRYDKGFEVY